MKKMYLLIVLIIGLSINPLLSNSYDLKFVEVPNKENCKIFEFESLDSNNCIALSEVDDGGVQLFKSTDQGRSWSILHQSPGIYDTPLFVNTHQFEYPDSNHIFVFFDGKHGIKKSTDGGKTFKNILIENNTTYNNTFCMLDSNLGFSYDLGTFRVTKDGWETYETREVKQLHVGNPITIDSENIQMFRTNDSINPPEGNGYKGSTDLVNYNIKENKWTTIYQFTKIPGDNAFDHPIRFTYATDSVGYAVGGQFYSPSNPNDEREYNIIYKTTDQGKTWKRVHKKMHSFGLLEVSFYDENNGVVVGHGDNLAMTNDGGETWFYPEFENFEPLNSKVHWIGKTFVIGDYWGDFWRYEGDFFKFKGGPFVTPFLQYPEDSSLVESEAITFRWKHSSDTVNFVFQLSHRSDMKELIFEKYTDKNISTIEYNELNLDDQYYWRVAATDGNDTTWSKVFVFSTGFTRPVARFPECGKSIEGSIVELKWTGVLEAEAYELKMSNDENFENTFMYLDYVDGNTLELKDLPSGRKYYWKVLAFNDERSTDWSDVCSFIIGELPSAELTYPEDGSISIKTKIDFKWESASYSENYIIEISKDSLFSEIVSIDTTKNTNIEIEGLDNYTEYYWKIKSIYGDDLTESTTNRFRTKLGQIGIYMPEYGSDSVDYNPLIQWDTIKGAKKYKLELSEYQYFHVIYYSKDELEETSHLVKDLDTFQLYYWRVKGYTDEEEGDWSETCNFKTYNITSVNENIQNKFCVSPNPAEEYIEISLDGAHHKSGHHQIEIYDVLGNKVFNSTFNTLTPALSLREREHRVDVSQLPKGVYFVKIGDRVEKFVKM